MPAVRKRVGARSKSAVSTREVNTREKILDATAEVLTRKGFSGTRLADVAEVAGIQAPGIYYYFPSRESLIEEVVSIGQRSAREHVTTALDEAPESATPMERLTIAVEAHLRSVIELSAYTTAATRNVGQLPGDMRARLMKEQADYGKVWHNLFEDASDAGEIPTGVDLFAARMLIIGAINWVPEWWNPKRDSIDDVLTTAKQLLIAGFGRR